VLSGNQQAINVNGSTIFGWNKTYVSGHKSLNEWPQIGRLASQAQELFINKHKATTMFMLTTIINTVHFPTSLYSFAPPSLSR